MNWCAKGIWQNFPRIRAIKRFLKSTRKADSGKPVKETISENQYEKNNPDAECPLKWKGSNLLGFALTEARDLLLEKEEGID